ncbi:MAG: Fe-S cluster assembly protein IscX [Anaerolineales bacterium]|nr:Fe-S cluster assembly protein IscX [Anaerolineales bacterium]
MTGNTLELYWDATYAIALALIDEFPDQRPEDVGLVELLHLVERLPGFQDDPAVVSEQTLLDILNVWYEETANP